MADIQLSPHFWLSEMLITVHKDIPNVPSLDIIQNLKYTCSMLEKVRAIFNQPMRILSGYRSPALNEAVGGVANSAHMQGLAADFVVPMFGTPRQVCLALSTSTIPYDQIIMEVTWSHCGFVPKGETPRKEVLTLVGPKTYAQGIVGK